MSTVCLACKDCANWSKCFEKAIANGRFADECLKSIAGEIRRWFLQRTRCREDADDLTQELCVSLCRYYHNFNAAKGTGRAYVLAIARNVFVQYLRNRRSHEVLDWDIEQYPDNSLEITEAMRHCIEKLDFKYRAVLIHRDLRGLSVGEVKEITGIPETTQRLYRDKAYELLEKQLKRLGFG